MIRTSSWIPVRSSNSRACRSTLATYASVSGPRKRIALIGQSSVGRSFHHRQLEPEEVRGLADPRHLVADAERDMVCRPVLAPRVHERGRALREADARVRVADPEGGTLDRLALGRDQLQPAVCGLR